MLLQRSLRAIKALTLVSLALKLFLNFFCSSSWSPILIILGGKIILLKAIEATLVLLIFLFLTIEFPLNGLYFFQYFSHLLLNSLLLFIKIERYVVNTLVLFVELHLIGTDFPVDMAIDGVGRNGGVEQLHFWAIYGGGRSDVLKLLLHAGRTKELLLDADVIIRHGKALLFVSFIGF